MQAHSVYLNEYVMSSWVEEEHIVFTAIHSLATGFSRSGGETRDEGSQSPDQPLAA